jgi:hypothetical protein
LKYFEDSRSCEGPDFGESRRGEENTHRYYRVPLLKVSRSGKCTQNRKMVWHFYGETKTAITLSKNQFRPQFCAQVVAGVETHPYSLFLGPGGHFWQSYEENQVQ